MAVEPVIFARFDIGTKLLAASAPDRTTCAFAQQAPSPLNDNFIGCASFFDDFHALHRLGVFPMIRPD